MRVEDLNPLQARIAQLLEFGEEFHAQRVQRLNQCATGTWFKLRRSEAGWSAEITPDEGGPAMVFALEAETAIAAELETMEMLALSAPPLVERAETRECTQPAVYADAAECFQLWMPCPDCGGYSLATALRSSVAACLGEFEMRLNRDREQRALAQRYLEVFALLCIEPRAAALAEKQQELSHCVGCVSRALAAEKLEKPPGDPWFDVDRGEWVVRHELDPEHSAVLPLGIESFFVPAEIVLAAAEEQFDPGDPA